MALSILGLFESSSFNDLEARALPDFTSIGVEPVLESTMKSSSVRESSFE